MMRAHCTRGVRVSRGKPKTAEIYECRGQPHSYIGSAFARKVPARFHQCGARDRTTAAAKATNDTVDHPRFCILSCFKEERAARLEGYTKACPELDAGFHQNGRWECAEWLFSRTPISQRGGWRCDRLAALEGRTCPSKPWRRSIVGKILFCKFYCRVVRSGSGVDYGQLDRSASIIPKVYQLIVSAFRHRGDWPFKTYNVDRNLSVHP